MKLPALGAFACMASLCGSMVPGQAADDIYGFNLAPLHGFAGEAEAARACRPDIAAWADTSNGYFCSRDDPDVGAPPHGQFACMLPAVAVDYWDKNPFSNMKEKGRSYPINPDLLCLACS